MASERAKQSAHVFLVNWNGQRFAGLFPWHPRAVKCPNLSTAAQLHIAQPSLSHQIAELETELQTSLLTIVPLDEPIDRLFKLLM